jgi:phytoene dehydrogenase-like protein
MRPDRGNDAIVVGSGPNGLAAAVTLARAGLRVRVVEGADEPGGGCRTAPLTLPGFSHDVCSAVHPLAAVSPFFSDFGLAARGVRLLAPRVAFAHPLERGQAAAVTGSVADTAAGLGPDGAAYRRLLGPLVRDAGYLLPAILGPIRSLPARPVTMARFALPGLLPASALVKTFRGEQARALLAGVAAHAMLPLTAPLTSAFGLMLTITAHVAGWPVVAGGSGQITAALLADLASLGGQVETGHRVASLSELPAARAIVLDVTPLEFMALAGSRLGAAARRALSRFRYGPGVCKVDWALAGPVPWQAPACRETVTVHVAGTFADVARSEAEVASGRLPERPYVIVVQPGVADPGRAPEGRRTLWAYCHVPGGSPADMSGRIEAQIERFAPGFRDLILARAVRTAVDIERYNPSYVGGDINAGAATVRQTLLGPAVRWNPYRTAVPGVYLCSAATPPGGGVHGMCGYWAARTVLADLGAERTGLGAALAAPGRRAGQP